VVKEEGVGPEVCPAPIGKASYRALRKERTCFATGGKAAGGGKRRRSREPVCMAIPGDRLASGWSSRTGCPQGHPRPHARLQSTIVQQVGPLDLEVTHQCADRTTDRWPCTQETITRGAPQRCAASFILMALLNQGLGHTGSEPLSQRPDGLTDLRQGRVGLRQLGFHLIQPLIKALMELLA
jgi:hypothetical protein